MNQSDIKTRIRQFVKTTFAAKQNTLTDDESLFASGIVDSLGILELVTFIENEFGILVADEDLVAENFESIHNHSAYARIERA